MPPEERRAAIVAAARRVFAARGYHRTGIADIVREVNIARGTFYRYFEGKREVFQVVVETMMTEVVGVVQSIELGRPVVPQVEANLERLVQAITAEDVVRVLFLEAVGIDDEGDEVLRSFYAEALRRIETALRTGQALGVVRPGDVGLKARLLLGLIKEPVVQAHLEGRPIETAQLIRELTTLLRHGLIADLGGA
jgi:AcrR family transcriptional regulator